MARISLLDRHHCAVLKIQANPEKPIDTRYPAEKS